jgi:hypothetical protein
MTSTENKTKRYEVNVLGVREKFEMFIKERQGVLVFESLDLSFPRGNIYLPKIGADGEDNALGKPYWAYVLREHVTDIKRFRFVQKYREIRRCKISLQGPRGLRMRVELTPGSTRRVRALQAKLKDEYCGQDVGYRFDPPPPLGFLEGQVYAVFEIADWED